MTGAVLTAVTGHRATVTLENAGKLNAMSLAMWAELEASVTRLGRDEALRCIVIRGQGDAAFSAGADISEFAELRSTFDQVVAFHENHVLKCLKALAECPVPTVAAIQGACFGGGLEIAAVCDIRLAHEAARFGAPVGRLGFPLAIAETQALFRLVGPATLAEMLIQGAVYDAPRAYEKGLLTRVAPAGEFEAALEAVVDGIARSGIGAARSHKQQIRRLMTDPSPVTREERLRHYAFAETDEYREGVRRFLARTEA
ncbi:enoyl-CoA hydratase/carnithine racemase [Azospirillum agricola]|uniref:enoyl-CoA hydratase/isomerase family protein n=1 Tax=Azospirillum agricola TaxID=1720247 RepID=UPI001AEA2CA3|nr:enoyl-CoA hydratase/isomerase family protein [Azospirillum agricola]MBP2229391.1 enoyl-CoA hydratase/carnithine racemase [Azospirillum agricola]